MKCGIKLIFAVAASRRAIYPFETARRPDRILSANQSIVSFTPSS
jgi:hypothetical protein